MSVQVIQARLLSYHCQTLLEQEHALKEIAQEIALMALARKNFFRVAAFQGGTCLRILYGLPRFSEDLDFVLLQPDPHFDWSSYVEEMQAEFLTYGYSLEVTNKSKLSRPVKMAFLKAESLGGILLLRDIRTNQPKLQIKLEIDSNPPAGSSYEIKYLDFPLAYAIQTQDLASLFASKCHALLAREYVKGRDWYDFLWYLSRKVSINLTLLGYALKQTGYLKAEDDLTRVLFLERLRDRIQSISWSETRKDVARFLPAHELPALELWSQDFFLSKLEQLS